MKNIAPSALRAWLDDPARARPLLLDVREPWELERARMPEALHIPMSTIPARTGEIDRDAEIVVVCHHGARSARVCMFLEHQGFAQVHNLSGGIDGWSVQVDPAVPRY